MNTIHLTEAEVRAVESILAQTTIIDPVGLIRSVGYDTEIFFKNHDWSFMDFRGSNLEGVSFEGAILHSILVWEDQVDLIKSTRPRLFKDPKVFVRESQSSATEEEEEDRHFQYQELELEHRKILYELQSDGRITNVDLAQRVGVTANRCLRSVRKLEEDGMLRGYRTALDPQRLGFEYKAMVLVTLEDQSENSLRSFEETARTWPLVRACSMLNGEVDFLLKCIAFDEESYQNFLDKELLKTKGVKTAITQAVVRSGKEQTGPPLEKYVFGKDPT